VLVDLEHIRAIIDHEVARGGAPISRHEHAIGKLECETVVACVGAMAGFHRQRPPGLADKVPARATATQIIRRRREARRPSE
jgi:hypothetical protein